VRSESRSRSRDPSNIVHSTGRGGVGNIRLGDALSAALGEQDEEERAAAHQAHAGM